MSNRSRVLVERMAQYIKWRVFWSGLIGFSAILMFAFIVSAILDLSGFESTYRDSLVRQFNIQGESVKGRIESSLNLGKRLYLLESQAAVYFYDAMRENPDIRHFYVADRNDRVLYTTRSVINERAIPFYLEKHGDLGEGEARPPSVTVRFMDVYYVCIPLYSEDHLFEGTLLLEFSADLISQYMYKAFMHVFKTMITLFFASLVLYVLFFRLLPYSKKVEAGITVVLLLAALLTFSVSNYQYYNENITATFTKNMSVLAKSIAEDFQKPLDYSVQLEDLGNPDEYLAGRIDGNPQCSAIYITDVNLRMLYAAGVDNTVEDAYMTRFTRQDNDLTIIPLTSSYGNGYLVLRLNRPLINQILNDTALDSGTIIIVSLIFTFILRDLFAFMAGLKQLKKRRRVLSARDSEESMRLIKISTFIFMFAAFVPLSFMPLLIQDSYVFTPPSVAVSSILTPMENFILHTFFLNAEGAVSTGMSFYMLGVLAAMLLSLFVLKGRSIRFRYVLMTSFFIAGTLLMMWAENFYLLMAARLVCGFGYGGILLNTSSLVIRYTNSSTRGSGFGTNAAAFAAASICSIPVGGIVVNKFGYAAGLGVSAAFAALFLIFSITCIKDRRGTDGKILPATSDGASDNEADASAKGVTAREFFRILFSRHVLVYLIFINIPFQLIYVGLFQFLLPLYMNDTMGLSQGNIGRLLSLFCIVSLSAASIAKLSDRVKNDKLIIAAGALIAGAVLIAFNQFPQGGFFLFVGVLIAMGLDNVSIDAVEELYVSSGNVKRISEENLLQTYKVIEKVASVFIPSLTTFIMLSGFSTSMLVIGLASALGALIFLLLGVNGRFLKRRVKAVDDEEERVA